MKKVILILLFVILIFVIGCTEKQLEKPNIGQPETDVQKEQPIAQPEKEVVVEEINETKETQELEVPKEKPEAQTNWPTFTATMQEPAFQVLNLHQSQMFCGNGL